MNSIQLFKWHSCKKWLNTIENCKTITQKCRNNEKIDKEKRVLQAVEDWRENRSWIHIVNLVQPPLERQGTTEKEKVRGKELDARRKGNADVWMNTKLKEIE